MKLDKNKKNIAAAAILKKHVFVISIIKPGISAFQHLIVQTKARFIF